MAQFLEPRPLPPRVPIGSRGRLSARPSSSEFRLVHGSVRRLRRRVHLGCEEAELAEEVYSRLCSLSGPKEGLAGREKAGCPAAPAGWCRRLGPGPGHHSA